MGKSEPGPLKFAVRRCLPRFYLLALVLAMPKSNKRRERESSHNRPEGSPNARARQAEGDARGQAPSCSQPPVSQCERENMDALLVCAREALRAAAMAIDVALRASK